MNTQAAFIRPAAVAGMFYPSDAHELNATIWGYLNNVSQDSDAAKMAIKAIVVPHAGYIYSGPIAASAYARILPRREIIRRVILLGPSHRVPVTGIAASRASQFQTPLGNIPLDLKSIEKIIVLPQVTYMDIAHEMEHSLEVHLPFLQTILDDFTLVPLVVGETTPNEVAEVLELLWGGDETLIVVSSDLSHYHNYFDAQQMDKRTSKAIENLQPEKIHYDNACGRNPLNGLLKLAKEHGARISTIDLRNSGDTAGDKNRVVGYGAYILNESNG
jgi:AmmeMemoRadiSam system protein B